MLCRWLSRKSSKRRNFTAHRDLQSRQYTPISSSRDYRDQRSCEGQKTKTKQAHWNILPVYTPIMMLTSAFESLGLVISLKEVYYDYHGCNYFIVKYNYKYYNWNIVIVVRFPVKTMSCRISWDASCAHLEVRKHNFVAKIVKTAKTDTAKCITIHHTNVKHSLWGKNCFSNLEIRSHSESAWREMWADLSSIQAECLCPRGVQKITVMLRD